MNTNNLDNLKVDDVYSLILFALYKIKDIPEYSTLSELAYIMDKKSMLNFLECFGGMTIRVPTLHEFTLIINSLLLYQYVNIEKIEFEKAIKLLNKSEYKIQEITNTYQSICSVLNNYDFKRE